MASAFEKLKATLADLQDEIERDLAERRANLRYRYERGRVVFEQDVRAKHRAARVRLGDFLRAARPAVILSAPVVYSLILPFVLIDLWVSLYQAICFPVYGIQKVRRADHMAFDHRHLAYLNGLQKLNCLYCSYCNGLVSYIREVAARTEQYWCPIKHARRLDGPHEHYPVFVDYGDAEAFGSQSARLRKALRK
ncbi:hypothetical protein [Defluviimonas salinarum]|uniref:Uncharacterized protein n=1 Tax=Defluviimonas salinarum TaxID=2992147 RepID=A0ABT3J7S7_9RHOB|nr:hypothetical protein [Defluviimonas salinarum]MCW3783740.1 hypothetical protein [Defluviimonas salinarum]